MDKVMKTSFAIVIAALIALFPGVASAADKAGGLNIVVIDMQQVMQKTSAGKSIRKQLEVQREKYLKQIKKKEDALLSMEQELKRQHGVMDPEGFEKKRKEFEKKVSEAQSEAQKLRNSLDKAFNVAMNDLRKKATKIIADVAEAKGVSVVLSRQSVVLAEKTLDITPEVVERLNKDVKDIRVSW